jgi:hypothetical protein
MELARRRQPRSSPGHKLLLEKLFDAPLAILSAPARAFRTTLRCERPDKQRAGVDMDLPIFHLCSEVQSATQVSRVDDRVQTIYTAVGPPYGFLIICNCIDS